MSQFDTHYNFYERNLTLSKDNTPAEPIKNQYKEYQLINNLATNDRGSMDSKEKTEPTLMNDCKGKESQVSEGKERIAELC